MIRKQLKKYITNYITINEKITKVNMNIHKTKITIFRLYALNNNKIEQIKDIFYDNLQKLLDETGDCREIIVIENFKRRTDSRKDEMIVRNFRKDQLNDSVERLINFCRSNKLKITNGFF